MIVGTPWLPVDPRYASGTGTTAETVKGRGRPGAGVAVIEVAAGCQCGGEGPAEKSLGFNPSLSLHNISYATLLIPRRKGP